MKYPELVQAIAKLSMGDYGELNSALGMGAIVGYTLSNPMFWVLSIVAFAVSYRLAA